MNAERDPRYPITFSAGAATYQPGQKPDLHALMMAADEAMYRDKQQLPAAAGAADCYSAL